MNWSISPSWATHLLTLEGGTKIWATEPLEYISFAFGENAQKISVVDVQQRPEFKTKIYLQEEGKLVEYEAEGMLTHQQAKRLLRDAGYDVRWLRFVLEYEKIV